jgi:hypothetical protein
MADEIRIMVSVADIADFAATLNKTVVPPIPDLIGAGAVSSPTSAKPQRKGKKRPVK